MSMIELDTPYGVAKFSSKTLAKGLKRAKQDIKAKEQPARRATDTQRLSKTEKA